ncbi:MAG: 2-amino-3,7-dideoxy-D-threo-hept-6-ulosonate synthase [bacterium]|jgi:DhnA family fructose-bisphosphate aldolase class Ia
MNTGKRIRLKQILREDGRTVIVALDHGGIAGSMPGIEDPALTIRACRQGGADCVLTTRGFASLSENEWDRSLSLMMRLTGGFTVLGGKFEEELITSVEAAIALGASSVIVTIKFGHPREGEFIRNASLVADACERWGIPLGIEAMAQGTLFGKPLSGKADPAGIVLAARMAQELGADLIKTYYTGTPESFAAVTAGCPAPVVILGGEKSEDDAALFRSVRDSMAAGGAGIAIGRNIWQGGRTQKMTEAMVGVVHQGWTVEQALDHLGNIQRSESAESR